MWAGFFYRQDVSISIFGRTKEFSEVRGTSLMCNLGVRSRLLDVIYGVRPPNGSPGKHIIRSLIWGYGSDYSTCSKILNTSCLDKQSRPWSYCFQKQSDQGLFCYSDKYFVNFSTDNPHLLWEQKVKSIRNYRTFTVHIDWSSYI